ncbi:hypothetical protein Tco_0245473 [Tanacetum coccineum]
MQPLAGGGSQTGDIIPLFYLRVKQVMVWVRDGGSGVVAVGGNAGSYASMRAGWMAIMSVWICNAPRTRSPAEGGDSEIGGDGDGVVMVRSLSTSASGGRDMEAWGRTVILAPTVYRGESWWFNGSVPQCGGKHGSSAGMTVVESAQAKCPPSCPPQSSSSLSSIAGVSLDRYRRHHTPSSPPSIGVNRTILCSHHPRTLGSSSGSD